MTCAPTRLPKAGNMGSEESKEMLFWTKEEYQKFAEVMMDKPISYYAFQMLYWTASVRANCWLLLRQILTLRVER